MVQAMTDLDVITKWGKERGLSYGKVSLMLQTDELTYEELGLKKPEPNVNNIAAKLLEQLEDERAGIKRPRRIKPQPQREKFYYRAPYQRRADNG